MPSKLDEEDNMTFYNYYLYFKTIPTCFPNQKCDLGKNNASLPYLCFRWLREETVSLLATESSAFGG